MAAVTICSDFGAPRKKKSDTVSWAHCLLKRLLAISIFKIPNLYKLY